MHYADAIRSGWPACDLERAILHDLPRRFHDLPADAQADVLAVAPPFTHTRWDALLAATVEHIARLHRHDLPAWIEEPARFLDRTWVLPDVPFMRQNAIVYAPAAFIHHGHRGHADPATRRGG